MPAWTDVLDVFEEAGRSAWEIENQADGMGKGGEMEDIVKGICCIVLDGTGPEGEEGDRMPNE